MNADEYIQTRLDDQIAWYDRKSQHNQRWFKRLRMAEFSFAALIPFVAGFGEFAHATLLVALLGVGIAIISASLGLYQFEKHWIDYRTTCESLRKERLLYLTGSEPYERSPPERFRLLVQRVEGLVSKENTDWSQHLKTTAAEQSQD